MAIDFVAHDRLGRADGGEPLHEEKVGSVGLTSLELDLFGKGCTYEILKDALGQK